MPYAYVTRCERLHVHGGLERSTFRLHYFASGHLRASLPRGRKPMQRILVIDDDPALTNTLRRGLAYEGYAVEAANSSRRRLSLAHERAPDLVILDLMPPELDGFEMLARLRSADAELPVLMLTARDDSDS